MAFAIGVNTFLIHGKPNFINGVRILPRYPPF